MASNLLINGLDSYAHYGVYVTLDGYNGLVQWPALKEVEIEDYPDEDGIIADLAEPVLDTKEFTISFYGDYKSLLTALRAAVYHEFEFTDLGITRTLRLKSGDSLKVIGTQGVFSLTFCDDFPLEGYEYTAPIKTAVSGFKIDDTDLAAYGITLLYGTLDELNKLPTIKENAIILVSNLSGAIYDGDGGVYKNSKDVTIKCFYKGAVEDFLNDYYALLHDLIQPEERMFSWGTNNELCYYKNSQVNRFIISTTGQVWIEFDITMCFTNHAIDAIYLLTAEDGTLIETEDGVYLIELEIQ